MSRAAQWNSGRGQPERQHGGFGRLWVFLSFGGAGGTTSSSQAHKQKGNLLHPLCVVFREKKTIIEQLVSFCQKNCGKQIPKQCAKVTQEMSSQFAQHWFAQVSSRPPAVRIRAVFTVLHSRHRKIKLLKEILLILKNR